MPNWLTSRLAGPIFAAIAALLLAATIGIGASLWLAQRQNSKLSDRIVALSADLTQCRVNTATLKAGATSQNAAIDKMKLQGELDAARNREAAAKAEAAAAGERAKQADLRQAKPGPDHCQSAADLIDNTLRTERK